MRDSIVRFWVLSKKVKNLKLERAPSFGLSFGVCNESFMEKTFLINNCPHLVVSVVARGPIKDKCRLCLLMQ